MGFTFLSDEEFRVFLEPRIRRYRDIDGSPVLLLGDCAMQIERRRSAVGHILPDTGPNLRLRNRRESPRIVDELHSLADHALVRVAVLPLVGVIARRIRP